jgi:hypothetical protein
VGYREASRDDHVCAEVVKRLPAGLLRG